MMKQKIITARNRKSVNVSVNGDLLRQAKDMKINLSRTLEVGLVDLVRRRKQETWRETNRQAINDYNERVERNGVFSDGLRRF